MEREFKKMSRKNILITGGSGFIGSNFIPYFLKEHKNISIINLDSLTYAGNEANLYSVADSPHYTFVKGDICNRELVQEIFMDFNIQDVIHFAAESHVDNSIHSPDAFIKTNINGTYTLLDVARHYWMSAPFTFKPGHKKCRFHHVSTDEVYGTLGKTGFFSEKTAYAPNSPYSASKASSDMLVRSYHHTYGMDVVITNCSNNYGPKQHDEKLIPTIIRHALKKMPIPIYGDGLNVRDWLYVMDHCKGINLAFQNGASGQTYNIGGRNEKNNLEVVTKICEILDQIKPTKGSYKQFISFIKDRPGHDRRYAIDAGKIEKELGWKAQETFETGIVKTIEWYIAKYDK